MRSIRRSRWYPEAVQPWLPPNEPPADCLSDLETEHNELSVWLIDDDRANLERVVAALASKRQSLVPFDCRLVPIGRVRQLRLQLSQTPGDSHDHEANQLWHRDLQFLSAGRLTSLSRCLWRRGESRRFSPAQVRKLLIAGIQQGRLNRDDLRPELAFKLNLD